MPRFVVAYATAPSEKGLLVKPLYMGADAEAAIKALNKELDSKSKFKEGACFRHMGRHTFHRRSVLPNSPRATVLTPQQLEAARDDLATIQQIETAAKTLEGVDPSQLERLGFARIQSGDTPPTEPPPLIPEDADPVELPPGGETPSEEDSEDPDLQEEDSLE